MKNNKQKMKTKKLVEYMKLRSSIEKVEWGMTDEQMEEMFDMGVRYIFGVSIDNSGNLLLDDQEPYGGFLDNWNNIEMNEERWIDDLKTGFNNLKTEIKSKHYNDKIWKQSLIDVCDRHLTELTELEIEVK